jgi:predicted transcriptional regulator
MLEIAPSAVSQYLSGKRGYRIIFEGVARESIERLAQDLTSKKKIDLVARICEICRELRDEDEHTCGVAGEKRCGS